MSVRHNSGVLTTLNWFREWPYNIRCSKFDWSGSWKELHNAPVAKIQVIPSSTFAVLHDMISFKVHVGPVEALP